MSEGYLIRARSLVEPGDGRRALAALETFARDAPPVFVPGYQERVEQAEALLKSAPPREPNLA